MSKQDTADECHENHDDAGTTGANSVPKQAPLLGWPATIFLIVLAPTSILVLPFWGGVAVSAGCVLLLLVRERHDTSI